MQKKGGKLFWGECWGSCEPQQILGGEFLEKCQRKNLGGKFWGGTCVGGSWEIKDKIGEKKKGARNFGGELLGEMKTFWGECWGSCEPQQILGGELNWKNVKEKI